MTTHLSDDDLVLHYYGELSAPEDARATTHLDGCAECHASYTRLQRVLAAVDDQAVADFELPPHFERVVWGRLEPDLRRTRGGWLAWLVSSPAKVAWAAAICVLVIGAFIAGRLLPRSGDGSASATRAADIRERILLVDLGEHLDRSQMVLIELVNADGGEPASVPADRARAEQLVSANRMYRHTAASIGDSAIVALLEELERVLVDVAAESDDLSSEALDSMRRRIESQGLLFKVHVLSSEVRDRRKPAVPQQPDRSS